MGTELRGGTTADQASVRRNNLSVVLAHLRDAGPRSRARVADETGLNKATVSSLVAELVQRGLVREGEAARGAVGRPGQTIVVDGGRVVAVGVEINVDYVSALVLDLTGAVVAEKRLALDTSNMAASRVIGRTARLVSSLLGRAAPADAHVVGMTVAVPGLVEGAAGTLHEAPNLGWVDVPITNRLRRALGEPGYPVLLDNEANLAALAELHAGGHRDLLLLTGAVGVGGGMVAGGRLVRGARGFAGEVGHMQLDPHGRKCGCGRRGCWETVVGLKALLAAAADEGDRVRDPELDVAQRLAELNARAADGDERTLDALAGIGTWLGRGASVLVNVLNPAVLVLGGYFAALGQWLRGPLTSALATQVFAPNAGGCRIELSTLGFSAAVRGGALRALEPVFDDPTVVPA
jgi:predicted NBD/HSP70 family sugar kinase